ncbi:MAG: hypothetical protein JRF53_06355, partial [Deltaproteobacteria bacterium]|nr:hypothetical protein [Deltaproteobacteria bacterium]
SGLAVSTVTAGSGSVTGFPGGTAPGIYGYQIGETVTLTATDTTPGVGSEFVNWTGDVVEVDNTTAASTTITMKDNYSIIGNFIGTWSITASARTGGTITPTGTATGYYGTDQTYTITANADYCISDVVVDDVSQGPLESYTFKDIYGNHTIVAVFATGDTPYQPPQAGDEQIYTESVPPLVLLVMGRSHKLYYEAYNDASDLDGDGTLDIRYNPAIEYYGYFDSRKVYKYDATNERFYPVRATNDKKTSGVPADNEWSGDFLNYLTMSRMDTLRKVLYGGYRSTDTATETVLQRVFIPQDAHSWGKEYESITRDGYDIKYYAPLDTPSVGTRHLFASTNLEDPNNTDEPDWDRPLLRVLPNNTHRIWEWVASERPVACSKNDVGFGGIECKSPPEGGDCETPGGGGSHPGHPNNHAEYEALVTTYAVASKRYAPGAPPANGRIDGSGNPYGPDDNYLTIFTGNIDITTGGNYYFAVDGDDAVEVLINGNVVAGYYGGHGACNCTKYKSAKVPLAAGSHTVEFRHEEAGGGDNYYLWMKGPDTGGSYTKTISYSSLIQTTYELLTPSTPTSVITDYVVRVQVGVSSMPESNCKQYPSGVRKPTGILQKYGEAGRMDFGLLTGSYANNTSGGVLRKPIGSITDEIDPSTGQLTSVNGIIKTIDKFRICEFRYSDYSYEPGWPAAWVTTRNMDEGEFPDWGNPIAEMMYEGLRYFAGKKTPTTKFDYGPYTNCDNNFGLAKPAWDDPYETHYYCAKPFLLVLSDIYPNNDSDQLPGSYWYPSPALDPDDLTGLHVQNLADFIFTEEGDAASHYIGQQGGTFDSSCTPKDVDGFGDIRGLCPEEPTKQGSYYSASVAYFGLTQDINPAESDQNVVTFVVGLASPLPRINIPVGTGEITLVPVAKSCGGCLGIQPTEGAFQPNNTIVDFFVEAITPTSGTFRINYEDVENAADHDMDAIVIYHYQVVDDNLDPVADASNGTKVQITLTSEYASGCIIQHLGYIISGTTADGTYLEVVDADIGDPYAPGTDVDYFLDTPPGVWAGDTGDPPPWEDNVDLPLVTTRTFDVGTTTAATLLKDPLWYAAKWGGFIDMDDNDKPDQDSEWDEDANGVPDTYFYVVNPLKLEQQLNRSFTDILSRGVSHVAPVVSVDEANRTQSGDKLYMAFFRPMPDNYWQGNLKKYGLDYLARTECGRTDPEWTVVDKNGDIAGECDGTFKGGSISFWSTSGDGGYVDRGGVGVLLKESMPGTDDTDVPTTGPYYDFRNIYTYPVGATDGALVTFDHANISKEDLEVGTDAIRNKIINYIYGYNYAAETNGDPVTKRKWILGDIIHSEPRMIDYLNTDGSLKARYIAVGSNDGMLHVFTDEACTIGGTSYPEGSEIFAFVPRDLLKRLQLFGAPNIHQFMVDGSANLFKAQTKTGDYYDKTLVFGERRGGRSYWALDVTNPDPSTWTVKWHIEGGSLGTTGFNELGYTWNKPSFAKIRTDATTVYNVAIFAGGYDSPLEDGFPEGFDDADEDGIWDSGEAHAATIGGTEFYDKYNPGMNTMGRGIFVVDVDYDPTDADHNQLILFKATYGDDDADEDEGDDVTTGLDQKYCMMKYCFPANMSVIPFSDEYLLMYAADVYGQIWKIEYDYYSDTGHAYDDADSEKWKVQRIFTSNPGSDQDSGDVDDFDTNGPPSLDDTDAGRKAFYSPDISYYGNAWTSYPVLYFGTGDRAHPRLRMISNRFYAVADHDAADGEVLDETDLFNLTCDELDDNADANGDGTVDKDDTTLQNQIRAIMQLQEPCRGFYRVMDKQGDCTGHSFDHTGEQVLSMPTLFFKTVYFTSYQAVFDDPCNPMGNAYIYAIDYSWGTAAFDYGGDGINQTLGDTFQMISGSSIPSGVRVITRDGHAAGLLSAGGAVAGAGVNFSTSIPGPPGGVSRMLWETD